PLLPFSNALDVRVGQTATVGVTLLFLTRSARSPQKAQRAISHFLDLLAAVFEFYFDRRGFTVSEKSRHSSIQDARWYGERYFVARLESWRSRFIHFDAPRLLFGGLSRWLCMRTVLHLGQTHLRCLW